MSFLLEDSEEENIVSTDSISQVMKGDKLEANNLQIDKLQLAESGQEIKEHSSETSMSNQAAHLQGPSSNASKKTESTPLPLLKLRIFPSPKIVNRLSELKKKNTRGPSKRLT